jgi:hypothetical protein
VIPAPFKFAAHLTPGDRIALHGSDQTVAYVENWSGPTAAVFTDVTGDDPWLLDPGAHVTICLAQEIRFPNRPA